MALFVAVHKWEKEDFVTVARKVLEALGSLPDGINLCSSYVYDAGGWCVYSSESSEAGEKIKAFLTEKVPEMTTEVTPVLQFFPPSADIYPLIHKVIEAATQ